MSTPPTCYIGRAGRDAGAISVTDVNLEGDTITVVGSLTADTEADVKVLRQQIIGLSDSDDDPVVPIYFTGDSTHTGFYEVTGVSVPSPDSGFWQLGGALPFQVTARRIAGYAYPLVQSVLALFARTNVHSVTATASCWWALPNAATEIIYRTAVDTINTSRTSADGVIKLITNVSSSATEVVTASYGITPAEFYTGSAKIEVGSTLRTVVGRQIDSASATPAQWRLSNGLIRVTPTVSGGAATGGLDVQWYDGSQWETVKAFTIFDNTVSAALGAFTTVRILRNTPEACALRLSALQPGYSSGYYLTLDLFLRRGARFVELYISSVIAGTYQIRRAVVEAASTLTGGIAATSNDADGNKYMIISPSTTTADTTNGRLRLTTAAATAQFAIGVEIGGTGASAPNNQASIVNQYLDHTSETQVVVGR